jgi:uncharacterized integral membrane protein
MFTSLVESSPVWDELKTCSGRKKLILLSFHFSPRSFVSIRLEVSNISKTMVQPVFKNPLALHLILDYILGICIRWFVGIFPKKILRYYVSNLAVICYWGYSLLWIVRPRSSLWFLELPDLFCLTLMMVISMRWDHVFEQRPPTNGFTVHAQYDRYISMESQGGKGMLLIFWTLVFVIIVIINSSSTYKDYAFWSIPVPVSLLGK